MSRTSIIDLYFNTTVTIQRRTNTTNSVGDFTESWSDLITGLKATIQALKITEKKDLSQGKEYQSDNKAYIPLNTASEAIKEGDRLYDTETSKTYDIKGIETYKASRQGINIGHHFKLYLEINKKPNS